MSESIPKIEKKVPLAADAALLINGYLEELNEKLVFSGAQEVYSIVNDTEEIIVEMLKNLRSPTKLGSDVVIELIHEKLGTPGEFVRQYLYDVNSTLLEEGLKIDYDSNQLVKRGGERNDIRHTHKKYPFKISKYVLFTPIVLIIFSMIILPDFESIYLIPFTNISMILTGLATAIYILVEIDSSLNGKTRLSVRNSIRMRSGFRGLIVFNLVLRYYQFARAQLLLERYDTVFLEFEGHFSGYGSELYGEQVEHFRSLLWLGIAFFLVLELVIIYRDHKTGLFPLEKDFKPFIRFATLSYILIIASIIMFIIASSSSSLYFYVQILAAAAGIWAYVSRTLVSFRFYTIVLAILLVAGLLEGGGYEILVFPYILIMFLLTRMFRLRERDENNRWEQGWTQRTLMSFNKRLQDYYNQEVI